MPQQQSAKSHAAVDPITLVVLGPLTLFCLGVAIYLLVRTSALRWEHAWMIAASLALLILNLKTRAYALRVQDRVIGLEERLRLERLGTPSAALSQKQLIALRFAPDAELPALARRAQAENLDQDAIKQAIATWRPDYDRI